MATIAFAFREFATILSGKEFKSIHGHKTFYRITNNLECHRGFQYKTGVNIDHLPFNPTGECSAGGLYFTEVDKLSMWITLNSTYIRRVEIMNDSRIYIEDNKFKADKFILGERILLKDLELWNDAAYCLAAVEKNGYAIEYVINQTTELCLAAVKQNGYALQHVKEQTKDICLAAVKQNGFALQYVITQTQEIYLAALKSDPFALKYVDATCMR